MSECEQDDCEGAEIQDIKEAGDCLSAQLTWVLSHNKDLSTSRRKAIENAMDSWEEATTSLRDHSSIW